MGKESANRMKFFIKCFYIAIFLIIFMLIYNIYIMKSKLQNSENEKIVLSGDIKQSRLLLDACKDELKIVQTDFKKLKSEGEENDVKHAKNIEELSSNNKQLNDKIFALHSQLLTYKEEINICKIEVDKKVTDCNITCQNEMKILASRLEAKCHSLLNTTNLPGIRSEEKRENLNAS